MPTEPKTVPLYFFPFLTLGDGDAEPHSGAELKREIRAHLDEMTDDDIQVACGEPASVIPGKES